MSIQSPVGTLDIKNATLRVGKLEVSNIQGVDTALNVTRANSVLIYDDQVSTTTFNGFTSSVGVRDTGNGYLDLAGGYVYWGQKLPNSWVMDFEMDIRSGTNAGPLYANVFSTTNTGGDGYSFTFNDSNDKISLYYDSTLLTETTVSGLFTASEDWQKVVINYERGLIAISLDGSRKFYYKDIERETPYVNGEYVSFSSASTDGRKIRDLRIVNGEKWVYSGESNLVYTQGSVGIGVTDPTVALDVSGTVKATAFDGDGSAITNISSANVGDFASNVVRIENLETSNGHIWSNLASNVTILRDEIDSNLATARTDLQSNVTILRGEIDSNLATARTDLQSNVTILRGEIDSNLATARTDLQSNVTILRGEIDSNLATARTDLQSNVTILRDTAITFMGTKTFQDDVVLESNLRVQGDLLVANTVNMTVSDPILELGSNNQNTGDVGLVMTRHGASNSNVAIFFDETADTLKLGYTLNGAGDSTLEFDSNALAVSVQGALTASTGTFSGDVGIGTTAPGYTLDVDGDINFTGTFYQGGSPFVSSLWTDGQDSLYYRSNVEVGTANLFVDTTTSRVGINTITPGYDLDVDGDINFTGNFYQGGSPFVSSEWTTGSESLYYRSNVEIGTANLFVDTTTSRVGINTITPGYDLDVHGTSNVGALTATSISGPLSGNASTATALETARTINGVSFDGTGNRTITANTPNTLSRGSYLTGSNFNGSAATTWAVDATTDATASKIVARNSSGDILCRLVRPNYANQTTISGAMAFRVNNSSDNYIRFCSDKGAIRTFLNVPTRTGGDASGTWGISITGNASTATALQTARTINGVSFDGTGNITITANTPNTLSRGSYLTGSNFNGSAATTWAVDATTDATASKIVARNSSGDILCRLVRPNYPNQTTISGAMAFRVNNSSDNYIRFCSDKGAIRTFLNVPTRTGGDASGTWGISITGNASTATALQTARTINGVSFDGTGNITITANTPNTLSRGSYLTGSNFNGSAATTWAVDATTDATASKIVARNSSGDILCRLVRPNYPNQTTISGAMAFRVNNSSDNYIRFCSDKGAIRTFLNVPTRTGGDASGTWGISITGNASTATALQTARTINGVSFDGTGNITITANTP